MIKSILLSIRPEWVERILNGKKTIEVRKQFPKDYKGWVYIYCTKNGDRLVLHRLFNGGYDFTLGKQFSYHDDDCNGKVVARFWCDKVEEIETTYDEYRWGEEDYLTNELSPDELYEQSCLDFEQLNDYLKGKKGYAIHISKLEIFDKPRELSEFDRPCQHWDNEHQCYSSNLVCCAESCKFYKNTKITKAPQNYCYIEGDE